MPPVSRKSQKTENASASRWKNASAASSNEHTSPNTLTMVFVHDISPPDVSEYFHSPRSVSSSVMQSPLPKRSRLDDPELGDEELDSTQDPGVPMTLSLVSTQEPVLTEARSQHTLDKICTAFDDCCRCCDTDGRVQIGRASEAEQYGSASEHVGLTEFANGPAFDEGGGPAAGGVAGDVAGSEQAAGSAENNGRASECVDGGNPIAVVESAWDGDVLKKFRYLHKHEINYMKFLLAT
jgi:hypothetical protein